MSIAYLSEEPQTQRSLSIAEIRQLAADAYFVQEKVLMGPEWQYKGIATRPGAYRDNAPSGKQGPKELFLLPVEEKEGASGLDRTFYVFVREKPIASLAELQGRTKAEVTQVVSVE